MSLFGSLSAGVAGMLAQGEAISVISDNLSNANTIGYKNTRTLFDQQVTSAGISGTSYNSGGVSTSTDRFQNAQGAMISTQSSTDLALSGNGFFVVTDKSTVTTDTAFFYTRAGAFSQDNRGFLTNSGGRYLLGWRTDSAGDIQNIQNPSPIELQSVGSSARATSEVTLGVNLTSTESVFGYQTATQTLAQEIDAVLADPTTADFVTDMRFYDGQGGSRDVTVAFMKRADNFWDYALYSDGGNLVSDVYGNATTSGTNALIGNGTLRFNPDGSLKDVTGGTMTANWSGGVPNGDITVNFGDLTGGYVFDAAPAGMQYADNVLDVSIDEDDPSAPVPLAGNYVFVNNGLVAGGYEIELTEPGGGVKTAVVSASGGARTADFGNGVTLTLSADWDGATDLLVATTMTIPAAPVEATGLGRGTSGVIQFAAPYNTKFSNQDGFGSGQLSAITVDKDGFVLGSFTNGESKKLWKLVVAAFQSPAALEPISGNLLRETDASGRPLYKQAGVGGTATIVSGALEQSTVDIASEFANMIVSQRAFQASSTIIQTVDQMLQQLMQLR